jgi:hypothetical protein
MTAVCSGHVPVVELLLMCHADYMACDDAGRSIAHYAAALYRRRRLLTSSPAAAAAMTSSSSVAVSRSTAKRADRGGGGSGGGGGALVDRSDGVGDDSIATRMMQLVCEHCWEVLDWFDGEWNTPLHVAAADGYVAIESPNDRTQLPLYHAIRCMHAYGSGHVSLLLCASAGHSRCTILRRRSANLFFCRHAVLCVMAC